MTTTMTIVIVSSALLILLFNISALFEERIYRLIENKQRTFSGWRVYALGFKALTLYLLPYTILPSTLHLIPYAFYIIVDLRNSIFSFFTDPGILPDT